MRTVSLSLCLLAACSAGPSDDSEATDSPDGTDGTGDTEDTEDPSETEDPETYEVGGTITGLEGAGLTIRLDGEELVLDGASDFAFDAELDDGDDFEVEIVSQPSCPPQDCVIDEASGTIDGDDAELQITCAHVPFRFVAKNRENDDGVAADLVLLDDAHLLTASATVTPGVQEDSNTPLNGITPGTGVAYDAGRDRLYVQDLGDFAVLPGFSTLPTDSFVGSALEVTSPVAFRDLCLDPGRDRLYATWDNSNALIALDDASTLTGQEITPDVSATLANAGACVVDPAADRLFVVSASQPQVDVYDSASTLTDESTPSRTISWSKSKGPDFLVSLAYDSCTDRLYVSQATVEANLPELLVWDDASTLDGSYDVDTEAAARVDGLAAANMVLDPQGRLWTATSDATAVHVFDTPESWSGDVTPTADMVLTGAVRKPAGMAIARE